MLIICDFTSFANGNDNDSPTIILELLTTCLNDLLNSLECLQVIRLMLGL